MKETTTIEISIEVYNKLHNICEQIRKIVHKKHITPDQALSVMLATRPLEEILIDMQLEGAENHVKPQQLLKSNCIEKLVFGKYCKSWKAKT